MPLLDATATPTTRTARPVLQERLRTQTHESHGRLHHHRRLQALTRAGQALADYWWVIAAYVHFYRAVETPISAFLAGPGQHIPYHYTAKLPWLLADAEAGGLALDSAPWSPRQPLTAPVIRDAADLVGVLYPIEGAMLGGQVIARQLLANHGLSARTGARFFAGYGEATARHWADFWQLANTVCTDTAAQERATEIACAVFSLLEHWLNDYDQRAPA